MVKRANNVLRLPSSLNLRGLSGHKLGVYGYDGPKLFSWAETALEPVLVLVLVLVLQLVRTLVALVLPFSMNGGRTTAIQPTYLELTSYTNAYILLMGMSLLSPLILDGPRSSLGYLAPPCRGPPPPSDPTAA